MSSMVGNQGMIGPTGKAGNSLPTGYKAGQLQQFTPEQMQLFQQMFGQVAPDSYLSRLAGGDQSLFQEMEKPALRQFNEFAGNQASRFSAGGGGPGALSSRRSSGFQNTLTSGAANFAEQLQSNRQNLQRQAIQDLMGISNSLLGQKPYENFLVEKQKKQGTNWGGLAGAGIGGILGAFGGPFGAVEGANFGHQLGEAFT